MILKEVQFLPLGDSAVVLQLGEDINQQTQEWVFAITLFLDEYSFEGLIEYVPAYTGVTLFYDPLLISYEEIIQNLEEMLEEIIIESDVSDTKIWDIPVFYGGESGPDLELVASHCGITKEELIRIHSQPEYLVHMIGFAPGFPYLGGMDGALETPRREQPRPRVSAGSVGIAGKQTGIYSIDSPGGWQIIGKTPVKLFDLEAEPPSMLKAGDKLRFVPITAAEFERMANGY